MSEQLNIKSCIVKQSANKNKHKKHILLFQHADVIWPRVFQDNNIIIKILVNQWDGLNPNVLSNEKTLRHARVVTVANIELCPIKSLVVSVDENARVVTIANAQGGQKLQTRTAMTITSTTTIMIPAQIDIEIRTHVFLRVWKWC